MSYLLLRGIYSGATGNIGIGSSIPQSSLDISGNVTVAGNIIPSSTLTYDLGSASNRWRDIYLSGNTIDLNGTKLSRHTNGNLVVNDISGSMLGITMNHIDLSGTIIRRHTDGSIVLDNGSGGRVVGRFGDLDVSGNIISSGNLDVSGNIISSGNLDVSGNIISSGNLDVSGNVTTKGNLDVSGNITTTGNIIIGNNLTVNGTTTTVNSTTVTVQDPIIKLGGDVSNNKDKGIEFTYYDTTDKTGFFGFDNSTGNFTLLKDATNTNEVFSGTQGTLEGLTFKSTVASGTAPLTVTSSTLVTNLNADLLEGLNPSQFMRTDISTSTTGSITSSSTITGTRLISTVPFGTAPLSVTSSTLVTNLNSMLFYGLGSTQFMRSDTNTSTTGNMTISGNVGIGLSAPVRNLHGIGEFSWTPSAGNNNVAFFNIHDNVGSNGSNYSVVWRGLASSGTAQAKLANFSIDSSVLTVNGIVNNLNPSWCMYKDSQAAPTSGTVIIYNTEKVTANNCTTNPGNGRATATKAGRYYVSFGCFTESGLGLGSVVELYIRKNGGQYIRNYLQIPYSGYYSAVGPLTCIVDLAVGDYIDVFVSSGSLHGNANCCFSGFMIG